MTFNIFDDCEQMIAVSIDCSITAVLVYLKISDVMSVLLLAVVVTDTYLHHAWVDRRE